MALPQQKLDVTDARLAALPPQDGKGCLAAARADHQVETFAHFFQQPRNVIGVVLTIAIHEHDRVARRLLGTTLDRCAVALAVRLAEDPHALLFADFPRAVGTAVIDDDDLINPRGRNEPREQRAETTFLVLGGDDDGDAHVSYSR